MDSKLDNRGRDLLDLCVSNQLRILNGRTFGDTIGSYTVPVLHLMDVAQLTMF